MDQNQGANKVIPFPGVQKNKVSPVPAQVDLPKKTASAKLLPMAMVMSVMLFSFAINHYAFNPHAPNQVVAGGESGRTIASVDPRVSVERDAQWERTMAESLAEVSGRDPAASHIGRPATTEEKLLWGVLEEKYTVNYESYEPTRRKIRAIFLQNQESNPAYVMNRDQFLSDYGSLFEPNFESAQLESVEDGPDQSIVESYVLKGRNNTRSQARIELDRHQRLISLKVEQI